MIRRYGEICLELDKGDRNTLVRQIFDEYCEESSPNFVQMKPELLLGIKTKMKEMEMEVNDELEYGIYMRKKKAEKIHKEKNKVKYDSLGRYIGDDKDVFDLDDKASVFHFVEEELLMMIMRDFIPLYFKSNEFKGVHKHPSGRTWRVLQMCSKALKLCVKIENELCIVLEEIVLKNEMKSMYSGSNGLDNLTKEGARELKTNLQDFREKIEMICVITKTNFTKGYRKASVLQQQNS